MSVTNLYHKDFQCIKITLESINIFLLRVKFNNAGNFKHYGHLEAMSKIIGILFIGLF